MSRIRTVSRESCNVGELVKTVNRESESLKDVELEQEER